MSTETPGTDDRCYEHYGGSQCFLKLGKHPGYHRNSLVRWECEDIAGKYSDHTHATRCQATRNGDRCMLGADHIEDWPHSFAVTWAVGNYE